MVEHVGFQNEVLIVKNNIFERLLSDEYLMKLVSDDALVPCPALDLRYKKVFPWDYTMATTDTACAYITFETRVTAIKDPMDNRHPAVKQLMLYVCVFCHESIMLIDDAVAKRLKLTSDQRGSRVDLMCARIDELLNGVEFSSFGRFEFDDQEVLSPLATDYRGKCNVYHSLTANRYGGNL